jgi:putative transposase
MPRSARHIIPDIPHHVIQRGNRQQAIFHSDDDRRRYLKFLIEACTTHQVRCLAWCLMDNHVHLVLTPPSPNSLRAVMASTHTRYAQRINHQHGLSGHLFQGRYASYPMDDSHLMIAVRYVENNPVSAGMVNAAGEWRWSSARAHLDDTDDGLTDRETLAPHITNWSAYLADGVEAADKNEAIEKALRSGRPMGRDDWINQNFPPPARMGRPKKVGTVPTF